MSIRVEYLEPRVLMYVIDARDLPTGSPPKTPGALLQTAAAFGVPWREQAGVAGDYVIAVFAMDRVSPSARNVPISWRRATTEIVMVL